MFNLKAQKLLKINISKAKENKVFNAQNLFHIINKTFFYI